MTKEDSIFVLMLISASRRGARVRNPGLFMVHAAAATNHAGQAPAEQRKRGMRRIGKEEEVKGAKEAKEAK